MIPSLGLLLRPAKEGHAFRGPETPFKKLSDPGAPAPLRYTYIV